ncbi:MULTISPECIES: hypothetical protein [unclassified Mameliella]|uniref:hypothetical protein n=1 Tax=unclassified Mameliella TaxID=2630630 RepID=UPI00273D08FA|nr:MULTISPECIES: hypothetical protein [unclassified Mameliella]
MDAEEVNLVDGGHQQRQHHQPLPVVLPVDFAEGVDAIAIAPQHQHLDQDPDRDADQEAAQEVVQVPALEPEHVGGGL